MNGVAGSVRANITPATVPDAAARAAAATFAGTLAKRMSDYALASAITVRTPQFALVLRMLGLLDWRRVPAGGTALGRNHVRKTLELDRVKDLISDPATHYRQALGWGDATFDPQDIFGLASDFFSAEDDVEVGVQAGEPFLRIGALLIRRDASVTPPGLRIALVAAFDDDRSARVELNDEWGAGLSSDLRMTGTVSVLLTPPLAVALQPPAGEITGGLEVRFDRNERARPFDVLGGTGLLSVVATNAALGVGLKAGWSIADGVARIDPLVFAKVDGLTVKLDTTDADSFVGSLLGGAEIEGEFDLGLEWRASTGLLVSGSGGIELTVPMHRRLGPVELHALYVSLRILNDGTLSLETSTALGAALGPLRATVDRLGAQLDLRLAEGTDARFGAFDLALRFKPPTGVGLAVDAAVVKGGGFLSFKEDEYTGVLELSIKDTVQVKAIGLLQTRLPGGQQGYSLLLIITAQFPPIQLSFGFVLTGVGGLIGVNRTMVIEVLRAGIRTRTVDSIMFPENPVQNAPKIISDLKTVFPPAERRFVFGPMIEIGWGTPTLIFGRIGVLLELPEPVRLAILGQIKLALPKPDEAIVEINLDALGVIEFERSSLSIDASLYDSRVAAFELGGDMALRLVWAPQPNFALSIGGLNPRFKTPPGFPELRRLTLSLGKAENPRLTLEAYTALTSNSVQFGAHLELYAEGGGFVLYGYLGFDALFILSPFSFAVDMEAGVELRRGSAVLMSIHLAFTLEGPTPWHAFGTASFKILFITISVGFDVRFGDETQVTLPPADVKTPFLDALKDSRNWSATLPAAAERGATRGPGGVPKGAVLVHPLGRLGVRQTVVPLNTEISKFGSGVPAGPNHFAISEARLNQTAIEREGTKEYFARGQFFDLPDKLAAESFELMDAGIDLGKAKGVKRGFGATLDLDYDTQLVENVVEPSVKLDRYAPDGDVFAALVEQGAAALSPVQTSGDGEVRGGGHGEQGPDVRDAPRGGLERGPDRARGPDPKGRNQLRGRRAGAAALPGGAPRRARRARGGAGPRRR